MLTVDDVAEPYDPNGADWNDDGVVVLPGFFADVDHDPGLLEHYLKVWDEANGGPDGGAGDGEGVLHAARPGGWPDCTPYMRHRALRDVVCDQGLADQLRYLMGEPAGVHLNLTGLVSTERNWHQDTYLNPDHVGDHYAAVWIALGDIAPESGPFQYIPGSHRWFTITREKMGRYVDLGDPRWPKHSEDVLAPFIEQQIVERGAEVVTYLPKRGDVLIWHGRLVHRGSVAEVPGRYRPALIAHYSGVEHRQDMPPAVRAEAGGFMFPLGGEQPVM